MCASLLVTATEKLLQVAVIPLEDWQQCVEQVRNADLDLRHNGSEFLPLLLDVTVRLHLEVRGGRVLLDS